MKTNLDKDDIIRIIIILIIFTIITLHAAFFSYNCKIAVNLQPVSGVAQPLNGAENK